ncbi:hypothetical protein ACFW2Y_30600 [Streptomyces sp. NPDC058877]|uniref:hypothetical protein n=1 Tax=Streptomyces sp. NPDC058877 TaxID=3346665 RepID=UPI003698BD84
MSERTRTSGPASTGAPETGHPCTKRIPQGWAAYEGHGGGHFWQSPKSDELEAHGAHYDPGMLLSGQPTPLKAAMAAAHHGRGDSDEAFAAARRQYEQACAGAGART